MTGKTACPTKIVAALLENRTNCPVSPFIVRFLPVSAPGPSQAISLRHLSLKNTETEHKCSVFWNFLLKAKELPVEGRTLWSVFKPIA